MCGRGFQCEYVRAQGRAMDTDARQAPGNPAAAIGTVTRAAVKRVRKRQREDAIIKEAEQTVWYWVFMRTRTGAAQSSAPAALPQVSAGCGRTMSWRAGPALTLLPRC